MFDTYTDTYTTGLALLLCILYNRTCAIVMYLADTYTTGADVSIAIPQIPLVELATEFLAI